MFFIKPLYAKIGNPLLPNSDEISDQPSNYVNNVIQSIFTIFFIVAVVYFIWHFVMAAYHMISSQGDPKKWEQAQKEILYSLVGIVIVFSIFAILKLAGTLFGISALETLEITWPSLSN